MPAAGVFAFPERVFRWLSAIFRVTDHRRHSRERYPSYRSFHLHKLTSTSGLAIGEDSSVIALEASHHKFMDAFVIDFGLLAVLVEDSVEFELAVAS